MILQTGNKARRSRQGFSFLEVMVASAVLSLGLVFVYKALFSFLDYSNHLTYRLYGLSLLDKKISTLERQFLDTQEIPFLDTKEITTILFNGKAVQYEFMVNLASVDNIQRLIELDVSLSWSEGARRINLSRSTYLTDAQRKI